MKKIDYRMKCELRDDLEGILLRYEDGSITLNEALELLVGDISDQIESLVEVINGYIMEVCDGR